MILLFLFQIRIQNKGKNTITSKETSWGALTEEQTRTASFPKLRPLWACCSVREIELAEASFGGPQVELGYSTDLVSETLVRLDSSDAIGRPPPPGRKTPFVYKYICKTTRSSPPPKTDLNSSIVRRTAVAGLIESSDGCLSPTISPVK